MIPSINIGGFKLQERTLFRARKTYTVSPIVHTIKDGVTTPHNAFVDNLGNILSLQEVQDLIEKTKSFYELDSIDNHIRKNNLEASLIKIRELYDIYLEQDENGLYLVPEPNYNYIEFGFRKRAWYGTCGWCSHKISSKLVEGYYALNHFSHELEREKACSVNCAEALWKDVVKDWIHRQGFQELFKL